MADQGYRPSVLCESHTAVTGAPRSLTKGAQTEEKHGEALWEDNEYLAE